MLHRRSGAYILYSSQIMDMFTCRAVSALLLGTCPLYIEGTISKTKQDISQLEMYGLRLPTAKKLDLIFISLNIINNN